MTPRNDQGHDQGQYHQQGSDWATICKLSWNIVKHASRFQISMNKRTANLEAE